MKNKSIMRKVITGILAVSLAVSASIVALADSTTSGSTSSATTNTQGNVRAKRGPGRGPQDSAPAMKSTLDSLVKAGTITQDQEDKITAYIKQKDDERKAGMDKVKNMTEDERKAYFEANKSKEKTDIFSDLASKSIITKAQADSIKKAMPTPKKRPEIKTQFDSLVKAGTITQDQEDKITAYMKQKDDERKAEMDKIKAMTDTERKAYFEANKDKVKTDILSELVSQGTITQEVADAIKKAVPDFNGFDHHGMKPDAPKDDAQDQTQTHVDTPTVE
jgi:Tfp pilus assembly protein PilP